MNILILDIETSPTKAFVWSLWGQNVAINQIAQPGKVLCWAAQWLGSKSITYRRYDDEDFLLEIHALLDMADAVVTYNGRRFDIPNINRELLIAGLPPYSPIKHIDLLETVKKQFNFVSNKMQFVLGELDLGTKLDHEGFPLWVKCLNNDPKAWKVMEKYNKQDVTKTGALYKRLLPWITSHPNHNTHGAIGSCPNCGSKHVQRRGYVSTKVAIFQRFQCQDCFTWSRSRFSEVQKEDRKDILIQAA